MEHIIPWSKIKNHEFTNMILLCKNCHGRVTNGEIKKSALKAYKRNLSIISARYSLYEMRYLTRLHKTRDELIPSTAPAPSQRSDGRYVYRGIENGNTIFITDGDLLHMQGLVDDGFVSASKLKLNINVDEEAASREFPELSIEEVKDWLSRIKGYARWQVIPTEKGIAFLNDYFAGEPIE